MDRSWQLKILQLRKAFFFKTQFHARKHSQIAIIVKLTKFQSEQYSKPVMKGKHTQWNLTYFPSERNLKQKHKARSSYKKKAKSRILSG